MKTFLLKLTVLLAALLAPSSAFAYDCIVDGICYDLNTSTKTATVTYGDTPENVDIPDSYGFTIAVVVQRRDVIIPSTISYNGIKYNVTAIGDRAFSSAIFTISSPKTIPISITIPNSVTIIGNEAFHGCTDLTSVEIPNSVMIIGNKAFCGCKGLTSIKIPSSVTIVRDDTFSGCRGLTSVEIPNSVTIIGSRAFYGCKRLTSITIPKSVTKIGDGAFSKCTNLRNIVVDKDNEKYDSRKKCNAVIETATNTLVLGCKTTIIPNSVTKIDNFAFGGCSGLTSVTIPNSVNKIGKCAFIDCSSLTSVTFNAEKCDFMGDSAFPAFDGCDKLTSITIGKDVTIIPSYAFDKCTSLTKLYCAAPKPPVCWSFALTNIDKSKCTLYVPKKSVSLYKQAAQWEDFHNITNY